MTEIEENPNNPTINEGVKINVRHYFQIRYKNIEMKNLMAEMILKLVKTHEISDFYIEEKTAFQKNRILYNYHTIVSEDGNFDYDVLEKGFLRLQR